MEKSANWMLSALAVTVLTLAAIPAVEANVSLRNGNFFIGYTDLLYPGGFEPKIERVYNSKTPYKGIFGWGWGNEYEVHLKVSVDGSVVVHEYGGGAENRFSPKAFDGAELNRAIEMIAAAAKKAGLVGSTSQLASYKKKLASDATFRNDEWEKLRARGAVKPRDLKTGTRLYSNRFSYQFITRVKGGYVRSFDNGRVEHFNEGGQLIQISDKNNNFIKLSYKDGKLERIIDNFNRKIFFNFNSKGLVEKIQGANKKVASYKYNKSDELIQTRDADGNVYRYDYSSDRRHNMVAIHYSDKTSLKVEYHPRNKFENVKKVTDRDGTVTEYDYVLRPDFTGVSVAVKSKKGKLLSKSSYEYHLRKKSDGEEWTYKMASTIDGDRTETVYNECCGLPIMIKRGNDETLFEYDDKGHVTKKVTPTEVTELGYHKQFGKVIQVVKYPKGQKKKADWSKFDYDGKGNLKLAKNSEGKGVRLFYDKHGRIQRMVDHNRRTIDFTYNENSKPIEIKDPKLGSIKVEYNNSGEIKEVKSSAGRKVAMEVTGAFQNLLDIIRPAGVTLSF